ncbi:SDR family oxidoreductase [Amorphus coralli]|uniref:SDR family oxidoreductase n=1 Tax=Amorphus coralli TaxID=340680 RepID=UPI0004270FF9|nr:SDR family oxidoreductase [Amorphus coralli]
MAVSPPSPVKTALVTGAARRIGRAIAEDLAAHGYRVALHCHHSVDAAEALAAALREGGGDACVVTADLADLEGLDALVRQAVDALGPLGVLVNNASMFGNDEFTAMTPESFRAHMAVNAGAPLFLAQAFARRLDAKAHGLVVNVTDQRVQKPVPGHFSYGLSKATLDRATITMAQALAPRVRVNAIAPGPVLKSARQSDEDFARQTGALLLGHGPSLDEFGATVRFLAATPSITGQTILLDGGQHLAWETPDVLGIVE